MEDLPLPGLDELMGSNNGVVSQDTRGQNDLSPPTHHQQHQHVDLAVEESTNIIIHAKPSHGTAEIDKHLDQPRLQGTSSPKAEDDPEKSQMSIPAPIEKSARATLELDGPSGEGEHHASKKAKLSTSNDEMGEHVDNRSWVEEKMLAHGADSNISELQNEADCLASVGQMAPSSTDDSSKEKGLHFDGKVYSTYNEMVEAKRERNHKVLTKSVQDISSDIGSSAAWMKTKSTRRTKKDSTDLVPQHTKETNSNDSSVEQKSVSRECPICLETMYFRSERAAVGGYKMHTSRCTKSPKKDSLANGSAGTPAAKNDETSRPRKKAPTRKQINDSNKFFSLVKNPTLSKAHSSIMVKRKTYIQAPDFRPVCHCTWCGPPLGNGDATSETLCSICLHLQNCGWFRWVQEDWGKLVWVDGKGKKYMSVRAFLSASTLLVGENMNEMPPKERSSLLDGLYKMKEKHFDVLASPKKKKKKGTPPPVVTQNKKRGRTPSVRQIVEPEITKPPATKKVETTSAAPKEDPLPALATNTRPTRSRSAKSRVDYCEQPEVNDPSKYEVDIPTSVLNEESLPHTKATVCPKRSSRLAKTGGTDYLEQQKRNVGRRKRPVEETVQEGPGIKQAKKTRGSFVSDIERADTEPAARNTISDRKDRAAGLQIEKDIWTPRSLSEFGASILSKSMVFLSKGTTILWQSHKTILARTNNVTDPDPRPCWGCEWCGIRRSPTNSNLPREHLCPVCRTLQEHGWHDFTYACGKQVFQPPNSKTELPSPLKFLTHTTDIVSKAMQTLSKEDCSAMHEKYKGIYENSCAPKTPVEKKQEDKITNNKEKKKKKEKKEKVGSSSRNTMKQPNAASSSESKSETSDKRSESASTTSKSVASDFSTKTDEEQTNNVPGDKQEKRAIDLPSISELLKKKKGLRGVLADDLYQVYNSHFGTNANIAARVLMCLGKGKIPPGVSDETPFPCPTELINIIPKAPKYVGVYQVKKTLSDGTEDISYGVTLPQFYVNWQWSAQIANTRNGNILPRGATVNNGQPLLLRIGIDDEEAAGKLFCFCYRIMYGADAVEDILSESNSHQEKSIEGIHVATTALAKKISIGQQGQASLPENDALSSVSLATSNEKAMPAEQPGHLTELDSKGGTSTEPLANSNYQQPKPISTGSDLLTSVLSKELTFPSSLYTTGEEDHINPVHTIIRRDILEVFVETSSNSSSSRMASSPGSSVHASLRARQTRFSNKVGLRCRFCKHLPDDAKSPLSAVFPETLAGLYRACCVRFRKRHLSHCKMIPEDLLEELEDLKETSKSRGSKKYWEESAYEKGLRNSEEEKGIIFCSEVGMS